CLLFQAEDGIRARNVTGVQTCALPISITGIYQLGGDPQPVAGLADRAFEHVADTELAPDLLHIDRLALIGEARIARDDEQPADRSEERRVGKEGRTTRPTAARTMPGRR